MSVTFAFNLNKLSSFKLVANQFAIQRKLDCTKSWIYVESLKPKQNITLI